MLRFLADENLDYDIVRGVWQRRPDVDILSMKEADLMGRDDPDILAFAAKEGRVVLSHDARTMTRFATDRIVAGEAMPGLVIVKVGATLRKSIDDILLLVECADVDDLRNRIEFVPF